MEPDGTCRHEVCLDPLCLGNSMSQVPKVDFWCLLPWLVFQGAKNADLGLSECAQPIKHPTYGLSVITRESEEGREGGTETEGERGRERERASEEEREREGEKKRGTESERTLA